MGGVVLRPARKEDFDALLAKPLPYRVRAFAAEREGRLLGIGGLAFLPDEENTVAAFLILKAGANRYKIALFKAALATLQHARSLGIRRLVALADKDVAPDTAEPFLARLGFAPVETRGEVVWVWKDRD